MSLALYGLLAGLVIVSLAWWLAVRMPAGFGLAGGFLFVSFYIMAFITSYGIWKGRPDDLRVRVAGVMLVTIAVSTLIAFRAQRTLSNTRH